MCGDGSNCSPSFELVVFCGGGATKLCRVVCWGRAGGRCSVRVVEDALGINYQLETEKNLALERTSYVVQCRLNHRHPHLTLGI